MCAISSPRRRSTGAAIALASAATLTMLALPALAATTISPAQWEAYRASVPAASCLRSVLPHAPGYEVSDVDSKSPACHTATVTLPAADFDKMVLSDAATSYATAVGPRFNGRNQGLAVEREGNFVLVLEQNAAAANGDGFAEADGRALPIGTGRSRFVERFSRHLPAAIVNAAAPGGTTIVSVRRKGTNVAASGDVTVVVQTGKVVGFHFQAFN